MPAQAKLASAVALSLALVGAGTSLAQSTTAPASHTAYVTLVDVEGTAAQELTGTLSCQASWHERVAAETFGGPACQPSEYAYAYPDDEPAPWNSPIEDVDPQTYVKDDGSVYRVAEVTYKTMADAPEGGPELVKAMASEIVPQGSDEEPSYAMPVEGELANQSDSLEVEVGPSPDEAQGTPVADTSLPSG